jgi:hypothetical protein
MGDSVGGDSLDRIGCHVKGTCKRSRWTALHSVALSEGTRPPPRGARLPQPSAALLRGAVVGLDLGLAAAAAAAAAAALPAGGLAVAIVLDKLLSTFAPVCRVVAGYSGQQQGQAVSGMCRTRPALAQVLGGIGGAQMQALQTVQTIKQS